MATLSICPATTVAAPVERVWELLGDPHQYATWWDARTERIAPEGPAVAGQTISASARALGKRWPVRLRVEQVDAERRQIRLTTLLPFLGVEVHNAIACAPVDASHTWVRFG